MRYELRQIPTSDYWYVYWSHKGRSKRVSTRTSDRSRAEQFLKTFALRHDPDEEAKAATRWELPDVLDWYHDSHGQHLESASDGLAAINRLKDFFGMIDPSEVSLEDQKRYIAWRQKSPISNETVNRDLSILSAALNRAYDQKKFNERPHKVYLLPRAEPRDRFLTHTELALGYAYMWWNIKRTKRYHHVLLFTRIAINTGARSGAILQLTWDRVDFKARKIWFPVPGRRMTKKRRTVIDFDHKLEGALRQEYRRQKDRQARLAAQGIKWEPSTVIEFEGQPVVQIRRSVVKAFTAVGVDDVSPNVLRHTFATWASGGGAHLPNLGQAMGHSNPSTTAKYAKHQPGRFKDVLRASRKRVT